MTDSSPALQPIAPDVFEASDLQNLGLGARLPNRMLVFREQNGDLLLHSPIHITSALKQELEALGTVRRALAPNAFHYAHLGSVRAAFPEVEVWGSPGLPIRHPKVALDHVLDADTASDQNPAPSDERAPFSPSLRLHVVQGAPKVGECVLFHEASATLVVVDLLFNVVYSDSFMTRFLLKTVGRAYGGPKQSRLLRSFIHDRVAYHKSVQTILSWPFERVIPSHGDIIDRDPHAILHTALMDW